MPTNPNLPPDADELIAEAEALHLRSTTHQHAKMLDDALQDDAASTVVRVSNHALKLTLALLDEHEAMIRRLAAAGTASREREALLERYLSIFLGHDERFQVSVGGNPNAVERMLIGASEALTPTTKDAGR